MILICTALRCEAQAIIESFKLTRSGDLFAGEQMLLYICGVRFRAKFKAGALCGSGAETDFALNATENFEILNFNSARNSERFGEILLSRRVDFALNIGVCGCADKGVRIGEAFYFDGTAAQEFCGEDGSKLYGSQAMGRGEQASKFKNVREREFCGASLDGKPRANLICVSEPKILNAVEQTGEANIAATKACGETSAQALMQGISGAADTKNFTRDATRVATQSATGGRNDATNTAARATQNTPCTAKDATRGRASCGVTLYDMESSLFVNACERAGVPWAMMKIVSDHLRGERLCKSFVYELVKARLPQIRAVIKSKI